MSSSKRTATQAQLPMPTAKRASTSRTSGSSERALVAPMPTEDQAQGDWVAEWASPVLVKGREALYSTAHAICVMAYNWWTKPILPTTHRPTRNIPSRSTRRPSETNVSPPRPPRQDENPSDSSGQASPPTPQPSGIIPPPPTGVTDYGPFIPQPPPREFAIPKMEVAEKMTAPIVKTDAMRMAEESERRQKVNSDWVRDFQRRRRNEQALEASFGEPGAIRKAFKRPHIFQAEHEARVKDALMKHLYKQSIDEGYGADYETFKDYVSYKERLASSIIPHLSRTRLLLLLRWCTRRVRSAERSRWPGRLL
ncbi:hypothetical protein CALCODRAFT_170907 [Calocera cornea HHB12733]|uniref:Uncharacterized protein n=1 Tax=Calocera cornea HHB12733 TaxID=1353952 RepID=A0A165CF19_9BASI|nr:hypothetical protein CALCODRAFT_170907 [Calocera cornea HHB12733]